MSDRTTAQAGEQKPEGEQPTAEELWNSVSAERRGEPVEETPSQAIETQDETAGTDATQAPNTQTAAPAPQPWETALASVTQTVERLAGKVAGYQSAIDKALAQTKAAGDGTPTKAQVDKAAEDPAEWKQLLEDFPEFATAVQKKLDAVTSVFKQAQPQAAPAVNVDAAVKTALEQHEAQRVDRKHPDWRAVVKTKEFTDWFETQPDAVKALADSGYSDDAIEMLDAFRGRSKATQAADLTARRQAARAGAAAVQRGAAPGAPDDQSTPLDPKTLWKAEAEARRKRRQAA